jgi:hypothetical protein
MDFIFGHSNRVLITSVYYPQNFNVDLLDTLSDVSEPPLKTKPLRKDETSRSTS